MKSIIKHLLELRILLLIGLVYTLFITIILLLPSEDLPKTELFMADKIGHIAVHAVLSFIWILFYFVKYKSLELKKGIISIIGLCIFYGIVIEILQLLLTSSRKGDMVDVMANIIGSFLGIILFLRVKDNFKIY